ncbi:GAF domain-containing protein [Nocardioides sp.]|uniref:GAF domain-containing protein n=1 Tax=Nocardioides sp. TaxID=35761 RepID=UPI0035134036
MEAAESAGPARVRGNAAPVGARERLAASWQRSAAYGVPAHEIHPVFTGAADDESLFYVCGHQVLADLHRTLAEQPVSLMLTDADGLVLNRMSGDHGLLRALDAVHLAPGFSYSEREAGTNGLGLALADRVPGLVRADEHFVTTLRGYTCAAAPVIDPVTGRLHGAVNLTTWSEDASGLLLALAQSAAGTTAALILARGQGHVPPTTPRGEVFRVEAPRLEPGLAALPSERLSAGWQRALAEVEAALDADRVVAVVGEQGAGRSTLLAQAYRRRRPRDRILAATTPAPADVEAWLRLWTPELAKAQTDVVVTDVDDLPAWAAERLRDLVVQARRGTTDTSSAPFTPPPFGLTAQTFDAVPRPLQTLVDTVVTVPPLRERPDDAVPLARHHARRLRGREIAFTAAAERALRDHAWPGNAAELVEAVRQAASRTDVVDAAHLPAAVIAGGTSRLTRIEQLERDEIVRVLARPGMTMPAAAEELGLSRATLYRRVARYGIPRTP